MLLKLFFTTPIRFLYPVWNVEHPCSKTDQDSRNNDCFWLGFMYNLEGLVQVIEACVSVAVSCDNGFVLDSHADFCQVGFSIRPRFADQ